jgi:general secretion pathway protein I
MFLNSLNRQGGFTLLEVIVALGIASVSILGISTALSTYISSIEALEERTVAMWVADNRLQALRIQGIVPEKGELSGTQDMAGREWHYIQLTEKTSDPYLYRVTVNVYTNDDYSYMVASLLGYMNK